MKQSNINILKPSNKQLFEDKKMMTKKDMAEKYNVSIYTVSVWLERAEYRRIINSRKDKNF